MKYLSIAQRNLLWAVGVAFLVTGISWKIIFKRQEKWAQAQRMTTVLKVRKFIPTGKTVTPDEVEEFEIPEAYDPPGGLPKKSELLDSQGRPRFATLIGVPKGEFLMKHNLNELSAFGGLAWGLDAGRLAISLRLTLEQSVAGLLQPGDFVDVLAFNQGRSTLLLNRIRVVAVGDHLWDPAGTGGATNFSKAVVSEPVLVTLMMSKEEALALNKAVNSGAVALALVSPLIENKEGG